MEDMTSSKLALRSLLKDSKEKRASSTLSQERAIIKSPSLITHEILPTEEKRKEQLRLGKVIFEFFEDVPAPGWDEAFIKRAKGRPVKARDEKAKNISIYLSKDHLELLDKIDIRVKKVKGRGSKVRFLMDS
jgi:hypothetical protein